MSGTIDPLAVETWSRLYRTFNLLIRRGREELSDLGISGPQYGVLRILSREGALPMGKISEELLVTTGNVTGLVSRLVQEGLVSRQHGIRDRRVVRIHLTPAGKTLVEKAARRHHRLLTEVFSGFSPAEKKQLLGLLGKLEGRLRDDGERGNI
jgi:MarR family 2-MHQ and catechol resistance regulon transcriptional repressor